MIGYNKEHRASRVLQKVLKEITFFIDDIPHSFMTVASGKWHLIETVCSTVVSEEQIVEHSLKTLWVAISNTLGSSTQPELTARQGE